MPQARTSTKDALPKATGTGALDKGLNLLAHVCAAPSPPRFTDLLRETGLPKATLHRLLGALVEHRLLQVDARDLGYRVGLRALEMAQQSWQELDVRSAAADEILRLGVKTGETVHLAVLDDTEVVYIDKVESSQRIRMFSAIGKRGPLHCTGVGKAMLAFIEDGTRESLIARLHLRRFTAHTLAEPVALETHLAEVRRRGYATDLEEHEVGIRCAAAPIFDYRGQVAASVSVTGPSFRITLKYLDTIAPAVVEAARNITRQLGGRP